MVLFNKSKIIAVNSKKEAKSESEKRKKSTENDYQKVDLNKKEIRKVSPMNIVSNPKALQIEGQEYQT